MIYLLIVRYRTEGGTWRRNAPILCLSAAERDDLLSSYLRPQYRVEVRTFGRSTVRDALAGL